MKSPVPRASRPPIAPPPATRHPFLIALAPLALIAVAARAAAPAQPPTTAPATDHVKPTYPIPYGTPTESSIRQDLSRIRAFLDHAMPMRVVDQQSRQPITDFSNPNPAAILDRGAANAFGELDYTTGVIHAGMLLAADVTGDPAYSDFTARHLQFLHDRLPYFRSLPPSRSRDRFDGVFHPNALDDCGSMCAALIKARRAHIGPDLLPVIEHWIAYIHNSDPSTAQFRLPDGTLARHRPQPQSVWADDTYMSIPALAQMGALTGKQEYFDDAANQLLGFANHLFNRDRGLFMHGQNLNNPDNPEFYWGRANGWAMMATIECLETLPPNHPKRPEILALLRAHAKALASLQSGSGLWHQMLDKPDTYLETSASAMFVFSIARAINRGYLSPVAYGPIAQAGWNGLSTRITPTGQITGTCVATTFASDNVYYYNRPTSPYAAHGYGPVLLAGAELLQLLHNPNLQIKPQSDAIHYLPTTQH